MSLPFDIVPPLGYGPGSQPGDGEDGLRVMAMPSGMRVYEPHLPDIADRAAMDGALSTLEHIRDALAAWQPDQSLVIPIGHLDAANRALLSETLGEGEVSIRVADADARIEIQEANCCGIWRIRNAATAQPERERIEIAAFPRAALVRAFPRDWRIDLDALARPQPGIINAPALLTEIVHKSRAYQSGDLPHVINLTLLPHTYEDLALIEAGLGEGGVTVLSRGYGNCRIDATATRAVWRVRYFNSADTLILDSFEICDVPEVACAAPEDIAESAARIADILDAIS